jgi:curved DNA-binding protein CbpA
LTAARGVLTGGCVWLQAGASKKEIKKAYKALALATHPDKQQQQQQQAASEAHASLSVPDKLQQEHKAANKAFQRINEAYATLSDPDKRKRYDALHDLYSPPRE